MILARPEATLTRNRVVLLGGFNAGKSTLVSNLIGEAVATRHGLPTTKAVTRFRFSRRLRLSIDDQTILDHASGDLFLSRWFGGQGFIDFVPSQTTLVGRDIIAELPAMALRGLELVDTPGHDSVDLEDRACALRALQTATAALYLMPRQRLVSSDDLEMIAAVVRAGIPFAYVVTRGKRRMEDKGDRSKAVAHIRTVTCEVDELSELRRVFFAPDWRPLGERSPSEQGLLDSIHAWALSAN